MNKLVIPAILAATVLVAGIFAFMPVEKASTVHTVIQSSIRDTVQVTDFTLATSQHLVLVDNAGTGGTVDAEVTWRFSDPQCQLRTTGAAFATPTAVTPDGISPVLTDVQHRDLAGVEALTLFGNGGQCDLSHGAGDFVTVTIIRGST